jgi:hypothetical protein
MAGPAGGPREDSDDIPVPEDDMEGYSEDVWTVPLSSGRGILKLDPTRRCDVLQDSR